MDGAVDIKALMAEAVSITASSATSRERELELTRELDGIAVECGGCSALFQPTVFEGDNARPTGAYRVVKSLVSRVFEPQPACPQCQKATREYCTRTGALIVFYTHNYASQLADLMNQRK